MVGIANAINLKTFLNPANCYLMSMKKQQALVMWILWFLFLQAALAIHFVIGGGFPQGENVPQAMEPWFGWAAALPLVGATLLRWLLIPRCQSQKQQFVLMVVGMALSALAILIALVLMGDDYPQNQVLVLAATVLALIQFAPSYATPGYKLEVAAVNH
jgi:hypothetical protein